MKKLRHREVKFACGPKNYEATQTAHPASQVLGSMLQPYHVINKHHSVQETLGTKFRLLPESYKFWNPNPWEFHLSSSAVTTLTTPLTHHMSNYVWLCVLGVCCSFWEHPTLKPLLALKSHYLPLCSNVVSTSEGLPDLRAFFLPHVSLQPIILFCSFNGTYKHPNSFYHFVSTIPLPNLKCQVVGALLNGSIGKESACNAGDLG